MFFPGEEGVGNQSYLVPVPNYEDVPGSSGSLARLNVNLMVTNSPTVSGLRLVANVYLALTMLTFFFPQNITQDVLITVMSPSLPV